MSTDWQLNPIHSGAFLRLQRLLPKLRGFHVLFVQHNNPAYRDGMIAALSAQGDGSLRILDARSYKSYPLLEQQLLIGGGSEDTHIISLESLTSEEQERTFKGLNYHREQLAENCKSTLIFWLPEPLINSLVKEAADFWAWREQVFDFLLASEKVVQLQPDFQNFFALDSYKKQRRINQIQDSLKTQSETRISLTVADMYHELGSLYKTTGEYNSAEAALSKAAELFIKLEESHSHAKVLVDVAELKFWQGYPDEALKRLRSEVLPVFIQLGDVEQQSETLDRIADILEAQGNYDEALRMRREEILPLDERTQNFQNKAVTMSKIADIHRSCGQLGKALDILRKDVLPIHEQLDDAYLKAVAMSKVADILQLLGQFGEALKIREHDQLPVFEQLGDVRSKAATMGQIADIMEIRGQLEEALRIRQEEQLPIYEQLGYVHGIIGARANLAKLLWKIDSNKHKDEVRQLLSSALVDARRLKIPEVEWIEETLSQYGLSEIKN